MIKKILTVFLAVLSLFSLSLTAAAQGEISEKVITVDEFKQMEETGNVSTNMHYNSRAQACCDAPRKVWRTTDIMHVMDPRQNNLCVSVLYVGDEYCTNCNSVWRSQIVYRQTGGCGQYH